MLYFARRDYALEHLPCKTDVWNDKTRTRTHNCGRGSGNLPHGGAVVLAGARAATLTLPSLHRMKLTNAQVPYFTPFRYAQ